MSSFWKPGCSQPVSSSNPAKNTPAVTKPTLSGNVMSMKFMKRKDDKEGAAEEEERKRRRLLHYEDSGGSEREPKPAPSTGKNLIVTVEKVSLYSALPGRRSFQGANKVVERQYTNTIESQRIDKKYGPSSEDVDDEELLKRYAAMRKGSGKGGADKGNKKDKKKQKKQ